jgi:hypothetical protein
MGAGGITGFGAIGAGGVATTGGLGGIAAGVGAGITGFGAGAAGAGAAALGLPSIMPTRASKLTKAAAALPLWLITKRSLGSVDPAIFWMMASKLALTSSEDLNWSIGTLIVPTNPPLCGFIVSCSTNECQAKVWAFSLSRRAKPPMRTVKALRVSFERTLIPLLFDVN